jgi:hypothetical protein
MPDGRLQRTRAEYADDPAQIARRRLQACPHDQRFYDFDLRAWTCACGWRHDVDDRELVGPWNTIEGDA